MVKVMAVILNYNSIEDSVKCAGLLKKQNYIHLQMCIVDNCSTDGSIEELKTYGRENDIIVIENSENRGFSAGNNIGIRKAAECGCDYVLIINPDVEIRNSLYVSNAVKKMEEDSKIAVLGTDVINMQGQHQNPIKKSTIWEDLCWPLETVKNKISKKISHIGNYKVSGYCDKLSGCCFFLNMKFVYKYGLLDENVFLYCEEPILAKRVERSGKKMYYYAEEIAYHMHKNVSHNNVTGRMNTFFNSRIYYLKEYSGYSKKILKVLIWSRKKQQQLFKKNINDECI